MANATRNRLFAAPAGSRIKHLKKPDGEPLWRADIGYDFLNAIFSDQRSVFTNPHTGAKQTFCELYLDALCHSKKCSEILNERLSSGGPDAVKFAMVSVLVNYGRMNTTLNFFPAMKSRLRTYHAIPALQSGDQLEYKQLQDAPRVKSILKAACEGDDVAETLDELLARPTPRANAINLLFIFHADYAAVDAKYLGGYKFSDLIMGTSFSSHSRAQAFLWLCWEALEGTQSGANPFGNGPMAPPLVALTEQQIAAENVDPREEVAFGMLMLQTRLKHLESGSKEQPKQIALAPYEMAPAAASLIMALPPATTLRERRTLHEFRKLVRDRRILERRRRHMFKLHKSSRQAYPVDDPIFDSDAESAPQQDVGRGLRLMGFDADSAGDHGEFFATMSKVMRVAQDNARALVPLSSEVPPVVQPPPKDDQPQAVPQIANGQ